MSKKTQYGSRVSHERWLVSYADFITLLFAFFVVMYAFAKAGEKKQVQVSQAVAAAFRNMGIFHDHPGEHPNRNYGYRRGANTAIQVQPMMEEDLESPAKVLNDLEHLRQVLTRSLSGDMDRGVVSIGMSRDGLVISLREAGFFESGSATPQTQTRDVLEIIGAAIADSGLDVRVEGHTDDIPIHNRWFQSNWELSAARATSIARMLLEIHAVAPEHLSAAGYGQYHPVATNTTAKGRAQNRRVDLVICPRTQINFAFAAQRSAADRPWRRITDP